MLKRKYKSLQRFCNIFLFQTEELLLREGLSSSLLISITCTMSRSITMSGQTCVFYNIYDFCCFLLNFCRVCFIAVVVLFDSGLAWMTFVTHFIQKIHGDVSVDSVVYYTVLNSYNENLKSSSQYRAAFSHY